MAHKKTLKYNSIMKLSFAAIFVVLVGGMIVTISNKFLKVTPTTSTKAAYRRGLDNKYKAYCEKQFKDSFSTMSKYDGLSSYISAYTYELSCGSLNYKIFNPGGVLTAGNPLSTGSTSEPGICCIPLSVLFAANDKACTNLMPSGHWSDGKTVAHIPAVCKDNKECTGSYGTVTTEQYTVKTSYRCDNVTSNLVNPFSAGKNYCCMMPLATNTP